MMQQNQFAMTPTVWCVKSILVLNELKVYCHYHLIRQSKCHNLNISFRSICKCNETRSKFEQKSTNCIFEKMKTNQGMRSVMVRIHLWLISRHHSKALLTMALNHTIQTSISVCRVNPVPLFTVINIHRFQSVLLSILVE